MAIILSENKNYFRCPSCGGAIVRLIERVDTTAIQLPGPPTCSQCRKQYEIIISEDLSFKIIERRGC